jgi:hypothetical protein
VLRCVNETNLIHIEDCATRKFAATDFCWHYALALIVCGAVNARTRQAKWRWSTYTWQIVTKQFYVNISIDFRAPMTTIESLQVPTFRSPRDALLKKNDEFSTMSWKSIRQGSQEERKSAWGWYTGSIDRRTRPGEIAGQN